MPRPRDRQLAASALAVVAAALLAVAGVASAPLPRAVFETDPSALDAFAALLDARDRGTWLVDFAFDRELAGGAHRRESITEAQVPPTRVLVSATTATVDLGSRRVVCTATDGAASCRRDTGTAGALPASSVYREAVTRGVYALRSGPDRRVASEEARCFELVAVTGAIDGLGLAAVHCFAADGVPLWTRVAHAGSIDTREARVVTRSVSRRALAELLDPFLEGEAIDELA